MITSLKVVVIISALIVILAISLQESKSSGLGGLVAGSSETFYSKNKTKTKEAFLIKLTIISAIIFAASIIAINILL
ncbi:MAG TPA: preprotein translocase subunit SecG [Clostridium sp.]|jgi:preprotein translocase subunit SecG|uniref:preprotein translocase subunit SecG n=1 Tax=unclassified Clostridium TaxID=2614128 RepID=UPI000EBBB44C|nr:preprotein translocase subunit SecG [Clostridium sp.]